jgi:Ran GTPase-activating protein (RanGAP) involved in mRNA processing and transport
MTCGVHPYFDVKIVIPPDQLDELSATFAVGPANGFESAYLGQSNYYRSTPRRELVQYVEDLYAQQITELDLGEVPGCEGKSALAVDFNALGAALQHNTFFQSVKMVDVPQPKALQMVGHMMKSNGTMTKVVVRNAEADCPVEVGEALGKNLILQTQILDISGNKIEPSSMVTLALGIREVTRQLTVLGLANCGLNDRSISSLFSALKTNWGFSLSLQDFDISGNKLDSSGNEALVSWLSAMKGASRLRRLGLSGVNLDGVRALPEIKLQLNLEYLDLSHNNLRKIHQDSWNVDMPASSKLRSFNLSHTNLTPEVTTLVLNVLFNNANLSGLAINLAGLALGHKGGKLITLPLNNCKTMDTLDLSCNSLGKSGSAAVFDAMPQTVTKLSVAGNFRSTNAKDWVGTTLSELIKSHEALSSLDLSGRSKFRLKETLGQLSGVLQMNMTLTELNLSDNHMQDAAFAQLCQCLRTNGTLMSFYFDGNMLTVNGHQAFLRTIWYNRVITDWHYPVRDWNAAGNSERHRKILDQIQRHINGNGDPAPKQQDPFSWYVEWPIPSSPAPPFVDIPEYLKASADDSLALSTSPRASTFIPSANYTTTTTMSTNTTAASSSSHEASSSAPMEIPPMPPNRAHRASVVPPPIVDYAMESPPSEAPPRLAMPASPTVSKARLSVAAAPPPPPPKVEAPPEPKKSPPQTKKAPPPPEHKKPQPIAAPAPPPPAPVAPVAPPPPPAPPAPTGGPPPPPPGGPPPPPAAPKAPKADSKSKSSSKPSGDSEDRSQLFSSINGFKGGLKKTVTNDRSAPILKEEKKPAGIPPMF